MLLHVPSSLTIICVDLHYSLFSIHPFSMVSLHILRHISSGIEPWSMHYFTSFPLAVLQQKLIFENKSVRIGSIRAITSLKLGPIIGPILNGKIFFLYIYAITSFSFY